MKINGVSWYNSVNVKAYTVLVTPVGVSHQRISKMTVSNDSKTCAKCKQDKPFKAFYKRSGVSEPTIAGHYVSECKACMKARSEAKKGESRNYTKPRWKSEQVAIDYLKSNGIPALPGKALRVADVDVVAWGHIHIEVKYAKLKDGIFKFTTTPRQQKRGLLAHIVLLVCDYETHKTYHLFKSSNPVFYINGEIKSGFHYAVGTKRATRHRLSRVVMVDSMMDNAQDRLELITIAMEEISNKLIESA